MKMLIIGIGLGIALSVVIDVLERERSVVACW